MKYETINQKHPSEINRKVWLIKKNGKIIDRCRQKAVAVKIIKELNYKEFEDYTLERDYSYRLK